MPLELWRDGRVVAGSTIEPKTCITVRTTRGRHGEALNVKTLQKFASVHASLHNHFNQDRHLDRRDIFKQKRSAALAEWRQLPA